MNEIDYYGKGDRVSDFEHSVKELLHDIGQAWERHERVDVECCFQIGDLFNSFVGGASYRRRVIEDRYGEVLYKRFRHFGWVAGRWPHSERGVKHSFSFYRDNEPGGEKVPTRKFGVVFCAITGHRVDGGDVYLRCSGSNEREFETRVTRDEYLTIGAMFNEGVFAEA